MADGEGTEEGASENATTKVESLNNFELIPAVSIRKGQIVQRSNDKYKPLVFRNVKPDTLDLLDILYESFEIIYLLDLDGIYKNKPAVDVYKNISQLGDFWLNGGVRYCDTIIDLLITGAQKVVLSTKTLDSLKELSEAYELSENIIFGLDYNERIVSPDESLRMQSPNSVIRQVKDIGIETCLFADLGRVSMQKPLSKHPITNLTSSGLDIYVGGGVTKSDLGVLKSYKVKGGIIELSDILENPQVYSLDPGLLDEIAPEINE